MNKGYRRAALKSDTSETDHVQVQNVKSARVYVFGEVDVAEEEVNNEELELFDVRSRKKAGHVDEVKEEAVVEVERTITEGDTLQNIALKYGVQVSELKRINNLIRDQDFFALTSIRVPIKRHGFISELLEKEQNPKVHRNQDDSRNGRISSGQSSSIVSDCVQWEAAEGDSSDSETCHLVVRTVSIAGGIGGSQSKEAQSFLRKMDNDIRTIVSSTCSRKDSLRQVADTLTCKSIQPLREKKRVLWGADCGMRWWSVVCLMFLIIIILPLVYLIYYEYVLKPSSTKAGS